MSLKDELRLKAELRAASVLLSALMRHTDAQDRRRVFEDAVVRETAYLLERGARSEAIRAFEDAAGEWAIRSRRALQNGDGDGEARRSATKVTDRRSLRRSLTSRAAQLSVFLRYSVPALQAVLSAAAARGPM